MEKMNELTIKDVKEFTQGKKVKVQMASAMSLQIADAIVIADPDFGEDGKITILTPDTECKIELDSKELIDTIYGNENEITIRFFNNMGSMDISIISYDDAKMNYLINYIMHIIKFNSENLYEKFLRNDINKIEFKLIEIIDDKVFELFSFANFSNINDKIMLMYLTDKLKDKNTSYGSYPIVMMLNGEFITTLAVMFYNKYPFLDYANDNDCINCARVYNAKDTYREAAIKVIESCWN